VLLFGLCLFGGGCTEAPKPRPNILLISIDTLRPDHLGCYGYSRPTSPQIDALARSGIVFEQAFTPTTWTLPAHASMLSGVTPYRHGAVVGNSKIASAVPMLAEKLKASGYWTSGLVSGPYVGVRFGFDRGFDAFVERSKNDERELDVYQPLVLNAVDALEPPFFLFVRYFNVHSPFSPEPRFNRFLREAGEALAIETADLRLLRQDLAAGRATVSPRERDRLVDLYDGEILTADFYVDELLRRVRAKFPDTIVILTSDHGEEFLEHGNVLHGFTLFDEVLRVPLIVAGPGVPEGQRSSALVSLVDITPTILDLAGLPREGLDGLPLSIYWKSPGIAGHPRLPLHTRSGDTPQFRVNLRGVRTPATKLVVDVSTNRRRLYDLAADPAEANPIRKDPRGLELARFLDQFIERPVERSAEPDPSQIEALKALGYQ
jgi:arylsulfatase A-like enzyme